MVREVLQDRETLLDDAVALLALDVRDKAHAARIVLVAPVVQALRWRYSRLVHSAHSQVPIDTATRRLLCCAAASSMQGGDAKGKCTAISHLQQ